MTCSNWELITDEYYDLIERVYRETRTGDLYRFYGLIYGHDDYYYGMSRLGDNRHAHLSCVGSIEGFGFELVEDFVETTCRWCGEETLTFEVYSDKFGPQGVLVEGLEHYVCSNDRCINDYETPQQFRARCDKIAEAYKQFEGA